MGLLQGSGGGGNNVKRKKEDKENNPKKKAGKNEAGRKFYKPEPSMEIAFTPKALTIIVKAILL